MAQGSRNYNREYRRLLDFYFQDYIFNLPGYEQKKFIRLGFFAKVIEMCKTFLMTLRRTLTRTDDADTHSIYARNWVFVFDKNNYDATTFLQTDGFVFVTERKRTFSNSDAIFLLRYKVNPWHYLKFVSVFVLLLRSEGKRAYLLSDLIFKSIGWMEAFDQVIRKYKPKSITFSNDHSFIPRALLLAAKQNNIPTIYIQHATVTHFFPKLEFDLNLLEGQDAFVKYNAKGIGGQVVFIGMPRFAAFCERRKSNRERRISTVGFAFNTVDSLGNVSKIIDAFVNEFPTIQLVIRKHAKDKRDFETSLRKVSKSIHFSDALTEDPFTFLLKCDVLIAGDSGIHLDARMLNVESYFYDFSDGSKINDLYGFFANGLVKKLTDFRDLSTLIGNGLSGGDVFLKARYYNHLIGTDMERNAEQLALHEVKKFLTASNKVSDGN